MQAYVEMRNAGADARSNDRRITATTRQLESMIRLSEAHARMRYSEVVEVADVTEANRLIREALKESAVRLSCSLLPPPPRRRLSFRLLTPVSFSSHQTDSVTGLIDLDLLTGQSSHQRKLMGDLRREVVALLGSRDKAWRWSDLAKALEQQSSVPIDNAELVEVVKALESEGSVRVSGSGHGRSLRLVGQARDVEA